MLFRQLRIWQSQGHTDWRAIENTRKSLRMILTQITAGNHPCVGQNNPSKLPCYDEKCLPEGNTLQLLKEALNVIMWYSDIIPMVRINTGVRLSSCCARPLRYSSWYTAAWPLNSTHSDHPHAHKQCRRNHHDVPSIHRRVASNPIHGTQKKLA